ncbi:glycosyltransferase family 4 protein [Rhodomicrobium sp. Az07]|uniref:glycosyltransferase family 4 protein n=1 Tax=Rhodomicrobium sp. Az07 TaxID=2839034 RepID=UPI001BEA33FD|nr:glycosyltransferase family 4 protein [Rhodomicrobium sp. Az07]MBT3069769.1 glycosyltransferase family 4 protein [Rhodomicrobium sp. Az07]
MTTSHPRLYYLDDIPTPYRLGLHRRIAQDWPGPFKIAFSAESEPGRSWSFDFSGLDWEILQGRQWRPSGQINPFSFKWNPGVVRSLSAFRPDAVVLCGYVHPTMMRAARWCIARNIPYAVTCETSCRSSTSSGWRWHAKRLAVSWIVRNMSFGLPVGKEAADYLRKLGPTGAPMYFFPNTPDTTLHLEESERMKEPGADLALRAQLGIPQGTKLFLMVGRLIEAKRPLDAIRSFQRSGLDDRSNLVLVGDGPLMEACRSLAAGDPRIMFTGWLSEPKKLASLMAISTALILPSEHEPWGAVVNEAMAAGIPVIASDQVGAALEIVEDGVDGFVIRVGALDEYAAAMKALAGDPDRQKRMGAAAQVQALSKGEGFAVGNLIAGALESIRAANPPVISPRSPDMPTLRSLQS